MSQSAVTIEQRWDAFRAYRKESEKQLLRSQKEKTDAKDEANEPESRDQLRAAEGRRSLPLELLAGEWLKEQCGEAGSKTYVMDRLLPTLVLGMEKLLTEVSDRGLEQTEESQYDFNPINLLAQYLMRNNPLHSNLPHNHPYCNKLKLVSEQLKQASLATSAETLAQMRQVSRERVEKREREEAARAQEIQRRRELLKSVFTKWKSSDETIDTLELSETAKVLSKFKQMPSDPFHTGEEAMDEETFIRVAMEGMAGVERELFDGLVEHLCMCGEERRKMRGREERRLILREVFEHCDVSKIGSLSRGKLCDVLKCYYDTTAEDTKQTLVNPSLPPLSELLNTTATLAVEEPVSDPVNISESQEEEQKKDMVEGEQREKINGGDEERKELQADVGKGEGEDGEESGGGGGKGEDKKKDALENSGQEEEGEESGAGGDVEEQKGGDTEKVAEVEKVITEGEEDGKEDGETRSSIEAEEFVSILELFVGANAERCDVERLATYVKGTYTDSAEDRAQRHQEVQLKKGESTSSNVDTD